MVIIPPDGLSPGADGNFYGVNYAGGGNLEGTIFQLTPGGAFSVMAASGAVGANPLGRLAQGTNGNFYGINGSTIFQMGPTGSLSQFATFNGANGSSPDGELLQGLDGSLNGTSGGGTSGDGALFVIGRAAPNFSSENQTMGNVVFTWSAVTNQSYQVQYTTNLNQAVWINLGGPITATNAVMTTMDSLGQNAQGFYRIILQ